MTMVHRRPFLVPERGHVVLWLALAVALQVHANPQLPALYELDDWAGCRELYCMVRVIVSPAEQGANSPQFPAIDDERQFRRTLLDRGVCLPASNDLEASENPIPLPPGAWNVSDRYILERARFSRPFHPDKATERAANVLVNRRLRTQHPYGLVAYTEIEYCVRRPTDPNERTVDAGWQWDTTIACSLALAVIVIGCGGTINAVRSWQSSRARAASSSGQFLLFDLYKNFAMVGSVIAHCMLFGPFLLPVKNIEYLETVLAYRDTRLYHLFSPFLMLVFFTMSAMLLTVKLLEERTDAPVGRKAPSTRPTFIGIVVNRLIRLQPLNLLTVGFCAVAYDRFLAGPLGPRQLIVEQLACQRRWWMNALFISNYNMHQPCLPTSWYISADFQLFLFITAVLLATIRWPQKKTLILVGAIGCSFLAPFLTVLATDYNPIGVSSFHEMRFFLLDSRFLAQVYTPSYNNASWSVCGMLAGLMYDRFQRLSSGKPKGTARRRTNAIVRAVNVFSVVSLLLLVVFVQLTLDASEEPDGTKSSRWWLATCYASFRLTAAACLSAIILRILLTERDFYGSVIVKMGAKLYYCVYLIHLPVFRIVFSSVTETMDITPEILLRMGLQVYVISYALAIPLHYGFEKPVMGLLRGALFRKTGGTMSN